ncbi:MAG TPA: hypothetical protein PKD54_02660 [Pirellulaceae bacterium]|nr:hypothetical protein [Pirellulaceae bacterium]
MARDIEEFLRQAALKRQQQQQQQNQGGGQPPRQAQPPQPPPRPAQPKKRVRKTPGQRREPAMSRPPETVSEQVRRRLDTSSLSDHAQQLGSEVALADDKLEARLHEKFDHDVGTMGGAYATARITKQQRDAADRLAPVHLLDLLKNPTSLRQAIIVAEILKRPDFD